MHDLLMTGGGLSSQISTALVFFNDSAANAHMMSTVPDTKETVFNTWPRASQRVFFENPSVATGEAANWQFDSGLNTFFHPNNTSTTEMIVSPYILKGDYELDVTMTSYSSDDDLMGAVVCFQNNDDGISYLTVWVHTGGNGTDAVTVRYADPDNESTAENFGEVIASRSQLLKRVASSGGWGGNVDVPRYEVRVNANKTGNTVTVKFSNWNDTDNLIPESEIVIDLTTLPRLGSRLSDNNRIGFGVNSQAQSYFIDYQVTSTALVDQQIIYSSLSGNKWEYNETTDEWDAKGNVLNGDFNTSMLIQSALTNRDYRLDNNTLAIIKDDGISPESVSLTIAGTETITFSELISNFTGFTGNMVISPILNQGFTTFVENSDSITVSGTGELFLQIEGDGFLDYKKISINS